MDRAPSTTEGKPNPTPHTGVWQIKLKPGVLGHYLVRPNARVRRPHKPLPWRAQEQSYQIEVIIATRWQMVSANPWLCDLRQVTVLLWAMVAS